MILDLISISAEGVVIQFLCVWGVNLDGDRDYLLSSFVHKKCMWFDSTALRECLGLYYNF